MGKGQKVERPWFRRFLEGILVPLARPYMCVVNPDELDFVEWAMKAEDILGCRIDEEILRSIFESLVIFDTEEVRRLIASNVNIRDRQTGQALEALIHEWVKEHT